MYIDGYPIFTCKNGYYEYVINLIFQPDDFLVFQRPENMRNKLVWGDIHSEELETIRCLRTTASVCKDRLRAFGASLVKAEISFYNALQQDNDGLFINFKNVTFKQYLEEVEKIVYQKQTESSSWTEDLNSYLVNFELTIDYERIELALFSILSAVPEDSIIEWDFTDVINGGWVSNPPVIKERKIILLTEGKTDSEFIKAGIDLFYPHLSNYYHFMDFELSNYEGSASNLSRTIKAFIGSYIENPIIAIFDNDSVGKSEMTQLNNVTLPPNIKVLKYPDIKLARNYPTYGPTGLQNMDINGMACSIEMYLGKDILKENETFIPIKWTNYIDKAGSYQGSLNASKKEVQKRFRQKVKNFSAENYNEKDWEELICIIDMIKNAWI